MHDAIKPVYDILAAHYGWTPAVLTWIGTIMTLCRLGFKWFNGPVQQRFTARLVAAAQSPDKQDDTDYEKLLGCRPYRIGAFCLDLLFSFKVPTLGDFLRMRLVEHPVYTAVPPASPTPQSTSPLAVLVIGASLAFLLVGCAGCASTPSTGTGSTGSTNAVPVADASAPAFQVATNGLVLLWGHEVQPSDIQSTVEGIAFVGTASGIAADTNSVAYLQSVHSMLDAMLTSKTYTPGELTNALANISIRQLRDTKVVTAINGVFFAYDKFFASAVDAKVNDLSPYVIPFLTGIDDGIDDALTFNGY
jgi:hypothetical protein